MRRNVGKKIPFYTTQNPEKAEMSFIFFVVVVVVVVVVFVAQKTLSQEFSWY